MRQTKLSGMKKDGGNVTFGFIILIVAVIFIFVGLPYLLQLVKQASRNSSVYRSTAPAGSYATGDQQAHTSSQNLQPQILPGESIFKGKVSISSVYTYGRQQINLAASQNSQNAIDTTGWKIVNSRGYETVIGRANDLPGFGITGDIWLAPGAQVQVFSGVSTIGDSYRVNKCLGWLANNYSFDPPISNYCPQFSSNELFGLDDYCQNLILGATSCSQPSADALNNASAACRSFVDQKLNYNTCVNHHRNDSDFFNGWRVYSGIGFLMADPVHDLLQLKDQSGLIVNQYQY